MAKRFIDTGIFDDEWFMDLSDKGKIFWVFLFTKCDHAGIVKNNDTLFKFYLGVDDIEPLYEEMGKRVVRINNTYTFLPKFIKFQYPKGLSHNVKAQESAIEILDKHGLWDSEEDSLKKEFLNCSVTVSEGLLKGWPTVTKELGVGCLTPQDKNKNMNKDMDKDKDKEEEKEKYRDVDSVIDYLNKVADASYKYSKSSRENISGRLEDGFSVDQCKAVIDFQVQAWTGTQYEQYLRPQTLFGPKKFEGYVYAAERWVKSGRPEKRENGQKPLFEFERGERNYPEGEEI